MLASLAQVRVHAGRRVEAHHTVGQEEGQVRRAVLHHLRAGLTVGPGDGDLRGEAVALQVHAVAADAQRVIHRQRVVLPGLRVGSHVLALGIRDAGTEGIGLAVLQVLRGEVLGDEAEGGKAGAVEKRAGAEGVKVGRRRIAEFARLLHGHRVLGFRVGHHDDLAFVEDHAAVSEDRDERDDGDVEKQVCQLAGITALGGQG